MTDVLIDVNEYSYLEQVNETSLLTFRKRTENLVIKLIAVFGLAGNLILAVYGTIILCEEKTGFLRNYLILFVVVHYYGITVVPISRNLQIYLIQHLIQESAEFVCIFIAIVIFTVSTHGTTSSFVFAYVSTGFSIIKFVSYESTICYIER